MFLICMVPEIFQDMSVLFLSAIFIPPVFMIPAVNGEGGYGSNSRPAFPYTIMWDNKDSVKYR